jgi:hypothetical protein
MLVNLMKAAEHGAKAVRADGKHRRESDRLVHGVPSADPVPEFKHVGRIDAEFGDLRSVGRHRNEMLRGRLLVTG